MSLTYFIHDTTSLDAACLLLMVLFVTLAFGIRLAKKGNGAWVGLGRFLKSKLSEAVFFPVALFSLLAIFDAQLGKVLADNIIMVMIGAFGGLLASVEALSSD